MSGRHVAYRWGRAVVAAAVTTSQDADLLSIVLNCNLARADSQQSRPIRFKFHGIVYWATVNFYTTIRQLKTMRSTAREKWS